MNININMNNTIKDKLITHEDPYHLHKTLGIFCILNYGFQYYMYFTRDTYMLNIYTVLPHILLHYSSFIFKVLHTRPTESRLSMFIWEELRLHSLIFAWRACFIILFTKYGQIITLLSMICADLATQLYGTPGVSTVRGQHSKVGKRNWIKELSGLFFSVSQMGATVITSGIIQESTSPILVFSTLPPIQTSAFGMTLIRKHIINHYIWTIAYSIELGFTYFIWYKEEKNMNIIPLSILLYCIRRAGVSKYTIWCSAFMIHNVYHLFI